MENVPDTAYAVTSDGVHIAHQVVGVGPPDLVVVEGFISHLDIAWEDPGVRSFREGLSSFSRSIFFDKRGVGLSDRATGAATLEERTDDILAVLDATGCERAVLMGLSEGAPTALLFAATYPERVQALVLHGAMARSTWAHDYPWATPAADVLEAAAWFEPDLFSGTDIEIWAPSLADDERAMAWLGRFRRSSISPGVLAELFLVFLEIDVRAVLPTIAVPTLVLHRRGDRVVNRHAGEWLAQQITGARYVEVPGQDHFPWTGDGRRILDEIEEFLTGARHVDEPDRVLATVLFTDIVTSTELAAALGDRDWRVKLDEHDTVVRRSLGRHRGVEIKTMGDGFLATFDGPGRAIRCAIELHEALAPLGIRVRAGLHTGEVEVRGSDVGGIAVHLAARVLAAAAPGEVLVSRTVTDLVAGAGFNFQARGRQVLKGVPGEWELFAVEV
ncbi:MAG: adenylate/guanylate cyclase domain-containing protein [Acidimicrobiales bacterium]|nr:adenylate/guanylate cyclase domain-containing protein [Acidimicrobiales bacterium]